MYASFLVYHDEQFSFCFKNSGDKYFCKSLTVEGIAELVLYLERIQFRNDHLNCLNTFGMNCSYQSLFKFIYSHIVPEYSFLDARGLGAYEGKELDSVSEVTPNN